MTDLQKVLLSVYKELKSLCDKNNLEYFAYAGTALGAVRHNGFIPWDDDIDIIMPLPDYNRLIDILKKNPVENIGVFNGLEAETSDMTFIRIYNKDTMFTSYDLILDPKSFLGVYIDIFPFIGTPNNPGERESFLKNALDVLSGLREGKLFSKDTLKVNALAKEYLQLTTAHSISSSEYICVMDRLLLEKEIPPFASSDFNSKECLPFEDTSIYIAAGFDRQLTSMFGDYMTPPKKKDRTSHHAPYALIDLAASFQEYQSLFSLPTSSTYLDHLTRYAYNVRREKEDILSRIPPLEERIKQEAARADRADGYDSRIEPGIKQSLRLVIQAIKRKYLH